LLRRVFDPDAYFDRALDQAGKMSRLRPRAATPATRLRTRVRSTAGAAVRGLKLAYVMTRNGQLLRHVSVLRRVVRRNWSLRPNSLDIEALVNLWIWYWHFASVTRYLSGTEFGTLSPRWEEAVAD